MELGVVLRGVKRLLSPPREGSSILQSLAGSLDSFEAFLRDPIQTELKESLQATVVGLDIPEWGEKSTPVSLRDDISLYCRFTVQGLALLCLLDEALRKACRDDDLFSAQNGKFEEQFSPSAEKTLKKQLPPPTPKALLSPAEGKSINTLVQFVVSLGIFPFLLTGADHLLSLKLGQMASQLHKSGCLLTTKACYLYHYCRALTRLFTTPVLGATILSRHLSDILVALLQICCGPSETVSVQQQLCVQERGDSKKTPAQNSEQKDVFVERSAPALSEVQREWCMEELSGLLNQLHQPLVVRELLSLQGVPGKSSSAGKGNKGGRPATPKWLWGACGRLLSERLMQKDGVRKVLLGIFDAMPGGEGVGFGCHGDWKRVQAVARIISSCPSQAASLSHYYSTISPQLLRLLSSPMAGVMKVAASTISLMARQQPALARTHLLKPLTQPLRLVTGDFFAENHLPMSLGSDLETSITNLHRLCDAVEPSSPLMVAIQPFLPVFFELWRASIESKKSFDPLRSNVAGLLVGVLNSLDSATVILFLRHLVGMPPATEAIVKWASIAPGITAQWSSEGSNLCVRCGGEGGEEEGGWSVEKMESVGKAILELVGTELKSSRLLGQFFIECLTYVVAILCQDVNYQTELPSVQKEMKQLTSMQTAKTSKSASPALLAIERRMREPTQREAFQHSLALYLTAAFSENMTSEVLAQADMVQLLQVLAVVIECHAHLVTRKQYSRTSSSPLNLLVVKPDLSEMLGGPITLSIALGYLSAILGGARQVEREHRPLLSGLLQPLEALSTGYPETELSALSGDLRVCVATLGAVWSAEMRGAAEGGRVGMASAVLSGLQQGRDGEEKKCEENQQTRVDEGLKYGKEVGEDKSKCKLVEEIPDALQSSQPASAQTKHLLHQEEDAYQTAFQKALKEAQDPEIPVKGHGLASLSRLIDANDREASDNSLLLLRVFKENLHHPDSYVYLSAIRGLVKLASKQPLKVLRLLCEEYAMLCESKNRRKVDKETGQLRTSSRREECPKQSGERDSEKGAKDSLEFRLKLGEALVHTARDCGELLPHCADTLLAAVLSNAHDPHPLIRASALSNLAEICQLLGYSFGRIHHEVLSCVSQLLLSDPTPQVQRAALLVFSLLLKGLSHKTVSILGDSLHDIYHLLKHVEEERERDELTRTHARAALGELDRVMRDWIFPQQTLSKNITILHL